MADKFGYIDITYHKLFDHRPLKNYVTKFILLEEKVTVNNPF